jgi:hypothetical protein
MMRGGLPEDMRPFETERGAAAAGRRRAIGRRDLLSLAGPCAHPLNRANVRLPCGPAPMRDREDPAGADAFET